MTLAPPPLKEIAAGLKKPGRRRGRYAALVVTACFFAYLIHWAYRNVNYAALLAELQQIPLQAVFMAMAINVVVLTLFSLRLGAMLRKKAAPCIFIATIGFTFNALLPFRIGEGVKIYFGNAYFGFPVGALAAATVMEKLYDAGALIFMAGLLGATSNAAIVEAARPTIVALAIVLVLCGVAIARLRGKQAFAPLSQWRIARSTRLAAFLHQGESVLKSQNVAVAALCTALIWTTNVCLVRLLFGALLPDLQFGIPDAMTLLLIAALAIAVPASPAGLGFFEAGIVSYLMTLHGAQTEKAIAAALGYHLAITVPHTAIAVAFLAAAFLRSMTAKPAA